MTEAPQAPTPARNLDDLETAMLSTYESTLHHRLTNPERLRELYGSQFWSAPDTDKLREFCQLAARLLDVPISQVNLITEEGQRVVAAVGAVTPEGDLTSFDWAYCQHVVGMERELSIEDATQHQLVCHSLATTEGGIRSYLGVPLVSSSGYVLGTFCVADYQPRYWRQLDVVMLTQLAGAIVSFHEAGGAEG